MHLHVFITELLKVRGQRTQHIMKCVPDTELLVATQNIPKSSTSLSFTFYLYSVVQSLQNLFSLGTLRSGKGGRTKTARWHRRGRNWETGRGLNTCTILPWIVLFSVGPVAQLLVLAIHG